MKCRDKMRKSYQSFAEAVFGRGRLGSPKLIIAMDKAHTLGQRYQGYKPSYYLCRAPSDLLELEPVRSYPIWTVFSSTAPKLSHLAKESDFREFFSK